MIYEKNFSWSLTSCNTDSWKYVGGLLFFYDRPSTYIPLIFCIFVMCKALKVKGLFLLFLRLLIVLNGIETEAVKRLKEERVLLIVLNGIETVFKANIKSLSQRF